MSSFEERVRKVVDAAIERHQEEHSEADSYIPSAYTIDDVYHSIESLRNLTSDVKSEVYRIEHGGSAPSDDQSEEDDATPEEKKNLLDKLKDFLDEGDRLKKEYGYDDLPNDIWDDWIDRLSKLTPLVKRVLDKTDSTFRFIVSNIIRSYLLDRKLKPLKEAIQDLENSNKKSLQLLNSEVTKDYSSLKDAIDRNNVHLSDVQSELITCCQNTASMLSSLSESAEQLVDITTGIDQTTADIQSKVNALQPQTTANNSLEMISRQKAMQATLDEIRGLL